MAVIVKRIGETIEIRYRDVPLLTGRAREVLLQTARAYVLLALHDIAGHIGDKAPVGVSGHLSQSFGAYPAVTGTGGIAISGSTIETLSGRVFSSLPYAIVIDQGRAPGRRMPPVDALQLWVQRKIFEGAGDPKEVRSVAWAIAISIARKGIRGREFVKAGVDEALPRVEQIFQALAIAFGVALTTEGGTTPGPGGVGI